MSQDEIQTPINVFEHFDGQKFTVRGMRESYTFGERVHPRDSLSSQMSNEYNNKSIQNRMNLTSIASKASLSLRGKSSSVNRLSKINMNAKQNRKKLSTLILDPPTMKYLKTLFWDEEHWVERSKIFNDDADISEHPSYTIKNVAYNLECELLYMEAKEKYDSQFLHEMHNIISSKQKIPEQYFTRRLFSYSTLWPPLHTKTELNIFKRRFFQLSAKERKRVDYLMSTPLSEI